MKYKVRHRFSANYVASSPAACESNRYFLSEHSSQNGFTPAKTMGVSLVELLVSLSVAAILIAASAPSMKTLIVNNRIDNVADELYGSLMLARSEAVKRQRTVSLCSTLDDLTCDESNAGWHHGWLIFTDERDDGLLNDSDKVIRRITGQSELISILWNRGYGLRFNSRGQTSQAGTFQVCDQDRNSDAKAIIISMSGRLRTEERGSMRLKGFHGGDKSPEQKNRGVGLIEVLISLLVITIGILGMAGVHSSSLQYNQSAYVQSQATFLATDMLDRIQANSSLARSGTSYQAGLNDLEYSQCIDSGYPNSCEAGSCTPKEMAVYDILQWKFQLTCQIPGSKGAITYQDSDGVRTYIIRLSFPDMGNRVPLSDVVLRGIL